MIGSSDPDARISSRDLSTFYGPGTSPAGSSLSSSAASPSSSSPMSARTSPQNSISWRPSASPRGTSPTSLSPEALASQDRQGFEVFLSFFVIRKICLKELPFMMEGRRGLENWRRRSSCSGSSRRLIGRRTRSSRSSWATLPSRWPSSSRRRGPTGSLKSWTWWLPTAIPLLVSSKVLLVIGWPGRRRGWRRWKKLSRHWISTNTIHGTRSVMSATNPQWASLI